MSLRFSDTNFHFTKNRDRTYRDLREWSFSSSAHGFKYPNGNTLSCASHIRRKAAQWFHRFSCFSVQVPTLQQQICTIAIARFIWWWDYMHTLNLYIIINIYINAWEKRRPMKPHIKWVVFSFRCKYINSYIVWIHKVFIQYNTIIMNFYQKLLFLPQNEQKSRSLFKQMKLETN